MRPIGTRWQWVPPVLLLAGFFLLAGSPAQAKPKFNVSEVTGGGGGLLICDLDGDGLKDLVLLGDFTLAIFYQDPHSGFTREPQQTFKFEHRPCLVWAAKLGGPAESLLVMTSEGVTELGFTNRTGPPVLRPILREPTIIPPTEEWPKMNNLRLSAATGGDWPLLLVPTAEGVQVWQHRDDWRRAQVLGGALDSGPRPTGLSSAGQRSPAANPGYTTSYGLDLSVGDVHGHGREDVMLCSSSPDRRTNTYRLYPQQTNGLFTQEPAMTYADKVEPNSWLDWVDINRNGHVDLIKSVWLEEPSFIPGQTSGKVLVSVHLADDQGRIPGQPQQVFRKNDWMPTLPVLDVAGDGYPDLVLGYSVLDTREGMKKEITAKQLDYSLRFYFHQPGGGFSKTAGSQRDVVIHMDQTELLLSWGRSRYFDRYVSLGGDFSGDGKTALLVRDQQDVISVYPFLSREQGFAAQPEQQFHCPNYIVEWQVADLNQDGVSDLIVREQRGYRIFISQKGP